MIPVGRTGWNERILTVIEDGEMMRLRKGRRGLEHD